MEREYAIQELAIHTVIHVLTKSERDKLLAARHVTHPNAIRFFCDESALGVLRDAIAEIQMRGK